MKKGYTYFVLHVLLLFISTGVFSNSNEGDTTGVRKKYDNKKTLTTHNEQAYPWRQVATANVPRWEGLSAVINGKMYVFTGFYTSSVQTTPTVEVYNPVNNTWTLLPNMPEPVTHQGMAVDGDKIIFTGGFKSNKVYTNLFQIYNVTTNTWSTGPSLPIKLAGHNMVRLGRKLHVFSGLQEADRTTGLDVHYVLDLDNMAAGWKTAAPFPMPRNHFSSAVARGKIYAIAGQFGHDGPITYSKDLHAYDPTTDTWEKLADLPTSRSHTEPGTFVLDGKIYVAGGRDYTEQVINNITVYDIDNNTWTEIDPLPSKLMAPCAKVIDTLFILSHGSLNASNKASALAYVRYQPRAPIYKLGFSPPKLEIPVSEGNTATKNVFLYTITGTANYTITGIPSWLSLSAVSSTTDEYAKELKFTANASGKAPGIYTAVLTATANGFTSATIEVKMKVEGKKKFLYLYGSIPPAGVGHDMKLADTGNRGLSEFSKTISELGFTMEESIDTDVLLTADLLKNYKVLLLGSNNRRFSTAEQSAVQTWVNNGGGLIAWSDGAFGKDAGPDSDNDLLKQFGMEILHDNGIPSFELSLWQIDHYINDYTKNGGIVLQAEGVSPVRTNPPAIILAHLPEGFRKLNSADGSYTEKDAAVSIAQIGSGRVVGIFDRNAFWNNGEGTYINLVDNKEFARRFVNWVSGNEIPVALSPNVSLTSPSNNASFVAPTTITLAATASDGDGQITKVVFYQGSTPLGEDATSPYTFSWVSPQPGNYSITAKAIDNSNLSTTSAPANITVNSPGAPISVNIFSPENNSEFNKPVDITIEASVSGTGAGEPAYLKVKCPDTGFRKLKLGYDSVYIFKPLKNVIQGGNNAVEITIKAFSSTVNWNKIQIRPQGNGVTPVVIGNYLPAGGVGSSWTKIKIPLSAFNSGIDFTQVAFIEFPYSAGAGPFEIGIREIVFTGGSSPFVWFGASKTNNVHDGTGLAGTLETQLIPATGTGEGIAKVEFYNNTTKLGEDETSPYEYTWINTPAGTHKLTAKAIGNTNLTGTSSIVTIIVKDASTNLPPIVSIGSPASGSSFTVPASIPITVNASDPDGTITKVEFYNGNSKLGEDLTNPYSFTWNNSTAGNYSLKAIAIDNDNSSTTSSIVTITLKDPSSPSSLSIQLTSPENGTTYPGPANIPLVAEITNGGATPYLRIQCMDNAFRKVKLGYDPLKIYGPKLNVTAGGNTTLEVTLKDFANNANWSKIQIRPMGISTTPVVIGNYIGSSVSLGDGWKKVSIPLSAFPAGIDFTQISFLEIPYSAGSGIFDIGMSEVRFTGGSTPFLWFGGMKVNNSHDGKGGPGQLVAALVNAPPVIARVDFYENNKKLYQDAAYPYEVVLTNVPNGVYTYQAQAVLQDSSTIVTQNVTVNVSGSARLGENTSTDESASQINAYPNPVKDLVTIRFTGKISGNVSLTLFDEGGKAYKLENRSVGEGVSEIELNLSSLNLPAGKYYLMVESESLGRCIKGYTCHGNERIKLVKYTD